MTVRKIKKERLLELIAEGRTLTYIAEEFGCVELSVRLFCKRNDIEPPHRSKVAAMHRAAKLAEAEANHRQAEEGEQNAQLGELISTGGRYADLQEYAAKYRRTTLQARADWFRLGMPVVMKRAQ